ncbi:alpha/beta fold hydrolase [Azospirillum picis]|uniref:Pimeloyl-ACP methyl ester carboxylesterase n=1 Tax=Azospirillum picis TaxID=488438 RepID=A0ABU0MDD2_9PROT|nr:alpha/beta hydrolase [Azospirillum picis]MBP2297540.1 pimeloyl-ACP methyl ester carboxylesterase [Azospirillum picis]MDQ0531437.1 pimeloyl-ACP methyl ester carboxylesterase [Azospirillum picis]
MSGIPDAGPTEVDGLVELGAARLEYRWIPARRPGAPTLVFLHEGLGCIAIWKDFPDRLAAATGCGALVYSRQGYGRSTPCSLPRPLDYHVEEADGMLPALLDRLGVAGDLVLVGHSDGATIALLAAAGRLAPRIRLAIAEAPHVFVEDVTIAGIEAACEAWRDGALRRALERLHGANTEIAFRGWAETWLAPRFRAWNIEHRLPSLRVPLLVIQGVADEYATGAQYEAIAAQSGGPVTLLVLEECGHTPHRDQPERVLAAMAEAIGRA